MPKIIIGAPIKNRAWILPDYLRALENINYHNKEYLFFENHSTDDSLIILRKHKSNSIVKLFSAWPELNTPGSNRHEYGKNNYEHLSKIRNRFLEKFLETDGKYLLSVDSDIIVPSDIIIKSLLPHADENTIIGAAVCNIPNKNVDGRVACNFMQEFGQFMIHPQGYNPHGLYNCDVIGACYMIPRKIIESGIRYAPDQQGEDIPFCRQAKAKGFRLLVNLDCQPEHRMVKPKEVQEVHKKEVSEVCL